jgi:general secretion pathway protein G
MTTMQTLRAPTPARRTRLARRAGLTLIELLVVLLVLGLVAGLIGPQLFGRVSEAKQTTARTQLELLGVALDSYRLDNGRYPTGAQGLEALWTKPSGAPVPASWRGPYLRKPVPLDPWGKPYQYRAPVAGGEGYELRTLGRDGVEGGTGEDADVGGLPAGSNRTRP